MNNDFDFANYFSKFTNSIRETKKEVTEKYVKGLIDKEEFIRRMNNAKD